MADFLKMLESMGETTILGNSIQSWLVCLLIVIAGVILTRLARFLFSRYLPRLAQLSETEMDDYIVDGAVGPMAAMVLLPLLGIFYFVVPEFAFGVFVGFFLIGYLIYEYVHYALHHGDPKTRTGKYLRKHHLTHHAHGRAGNFGVSTPLWDFILRTTLPR